MASTSQKKTTKKTSGKSGSRTTAKKPQPRPIRREVGGVVCLVLALCVFVSYFGISAIFIDWLAVLIKGLLGYGYWLFGPALVLAQPARTLAAAVIGGPERVHDGLSRLAEVTGADELMLVCDVFDPELRLRSLDIAASAMEK